MDAWGGSSIASMVPERARWIEVSSPEGLVCLSCPWLGATTSDIRLALSVARQCPVPEEERALGTQQQPSPARLPNVR
eukprot:290769-Pyramimonas_sp.AAC.1